MFLKLIEETLFIQYHKWEIYLLWVFSWVPTLNYEGFFPFYSASALIFPFHLGILLTLQLDTCPILPFQVMLGGIQAVLTLFRYHSSINEASMVVVVYLMRR